MQPTQLTVDMAPVVPLDDEHSLVLEPCELGRGHEQAESLSGAQTQVLVEVVVGDPRDRRFEDVRGRDPIRRPRPSLSRSVHCELGLGPGEREVPSPCRRRLLPGVGIGA